MEHENNFNPEIPIENFTIEYPLNYEEIVERKLTNLEKDYTETVRANIRSENEITSDSDSEDKIEQAENSLGYNLYQSLHEAEDDDFEIVDEECNIINSKNREVNFTSDLTQIETYCQKNEELSNSKERNIPINLKNVEKIKLTMKSINMKPPKWAQKYVI